jgi:thiol-disulfide isomerase/thioredoxin
MFRKSLLYFTCSCLITVALGVFPPAVEAVSPDSPWVTLTAEGEAQVHLYFFWSPTCPHCRRAKPFLSELAAQWPWLQVHSHDVATDPDSRERYRRMAAALGEEARSVPAFLICGTLTVGFDAAAGVGRHLRRLIHACHERTGTLPIVAESNPLDFGVPLLGRIDPRALSLPVLTLVLAGLDAFNPCAFFVLLFLLSLLVHTRHRGRMLLIGGVFIFFSGFVYFLFMAAWLNAFLLLGPLQWVSWLAGLVAVLIGGLNIKDYFWLRGGPSLSIPAAAKPGLFHRMRALLSGERLPALLAGTVTLAIAANSYELLCTAGFPMVYTRTLTLSDLSQGEYYFYLIIYNVVYITPLLAILAGFVLTLGARKLQEREGRILKLVSGNMMLGLGLLLLFFPQGLTQAGIAVLALVGALALSGIIILWDRTTARHA